MSGNSVINTNLKSLIAQDSSNINNRKLSTSMERLSTGNKINSAKDDSAGLAISTRMDSQIRGLNMAVKNAYDTVSLTETAEGAMEEVTNMLQRMRELALQAANDTNSDLDRRYIQDEIDQLAAEIDRVSDTTQFNSINVLDGSYNSKVFQIGSNESQTMNISIGSMHTSTLGVATSNSAAASIQKNSSSSSAAGGNAAVEGAVAQGTAPTNTVVNLKFLNNSGSDAYTFKVVDGITGLTAEVSQLTVDMTSQVSKDAFAASFNLSAQSGQIDSTITSSTNFSSDTSNSLDLTNSANFGKVKFAISVDGGATVQVDLRDKLLSTNGVTSSAVTETQVIAAMDAELERLFDARVGAASASGAITVTDQEGRRLKITQGAGDGALFGTDEANGGGLLARETMRNNISAEWNGDNLVLTNAAGGKISVSGYSTTSNSQVVFDVVDDAQTDGLNEPILLATANGNMLTQATAQFTGRTEETALTIRFSDLVGASAGEAAQYSFQLTNGDGDVYADFSSAASLAIGGSAGLQSVIANQIEASVMAAISAGIVANYGADSSIDAQEFEVVYSGDTLTIRNREGRSLAIEAASSGDGNMTVTPVNEPGAAAILASQNAFASEMRVQLNTGAFGLGLSATGTNRFLFAVDGEQNSADFTLNVSAGLTDGAAFASVVEAAIADRVGGSADIMIMSTNVADGVTAIVTADTSNVTVTYDADTAELVFRDPAGRALGFGYDASANGLANTGVGPLLEEYVTGPQNKNYDVRTSSATAQGDVIASTEVKVAFDRDEARFNFNINGNYLSGTGDTNTSAAMANAITWETTQPFESSSLKTDLDALMVRLNSVHDKDVFEYQVDSATRSITFFQRDGGELNIGGFVTPESHKDMVATITPVTSDQGEETTMKFMNQVKQLFATANGTQGIATSATLNLEGDDLYGFTMSDGTQSFTLNPSVVDISNTTSTSKFVEAIEDALLGSDIKVSMDTDGNVFFRRDDGGAIILQSFTSATGKAGSWTPGSGQGDAVALDGTGSVPLTVNLTSNSTGSSNYSPVSGGGSQAIAEISVTTQDGASTAIGAIDSALAYVQAERSNLGSIQNRLTHTIDNLSNIVTSTSAAQSRIRDTDYAKETSELARTQIIQQAATAMLAQANQQPQLVLQLLQ
ncbi:flagellin [Betaproteobacteria bacterium]|nr:flagellin [Betaproteobacteria bacterium]